MRPGALMGQYGQPECFDRGSARQYRAPGSMGSRMMQKKCTGFHYCPYQSEGKTAPGPFWDEGRREFPPHWSEGK